MGTVSEWTRATSVSIGLDRRGRQVSQVIRPADSISETVTGFREVLGHKDCYDRHGGPKFFVNFLELISVKF